eukprot:3683503-Lingulodinium_polyedra.AAC.1
MEHQTGCSLGRGAVIAGLWGMPFCQEGARERQPQQQHRRRAAFAKRDALMEFLTGEIELPRML